MQQPIIARLALGFYSAVMNLLVPPAILLALPFLLPIRKRRKTLLPRLGFQAYPDADSLRDKAIWIHALSVGELLSGISVIKELRAELPARPIYLSVSTLAAREIAAEKAGACIDGLFYFPYDLVFAVRRCVLKIRPAMFLLIETDIWPGFLAELRRLKIPCFLLNGRLSPSSFRSSQFLSALFVPAFNTFSRIYPQSAGDAGRFLDLGVESQKMYHSGNLKFDLESGPPSLGDAGELRRRFGLVEDDRVFLAGSTHPGEESMLRSVFQELRRLFPRLKLIIVPRHPARTEEIAGLFHGDPFRVARFSKLSHSSPDVVVVDAMGVLGSLYSLADIAFVGGSMVRKGGHNPIEPAAAGRPVLFGPDMSDFPEVSRSLMEAGGAIQVRNPAELLEQCKRLLQDRNLVETMGMRARSLVDEHRGASKIIANELAALLGARQG